MKKIWGILSIMSFMMVGCVEPETPATTDNKESAMLSFGFYAEDNDVITEDYVIESISGSAIDIVLPYGLELSALENLVARFSVPEGATVTYNDEIIVSGETVINYSSPVDLIVSKGDSNSIYSVTVTIAGPATWKQAAVTNLEENEKARLDPYLAIDRASGMPYILGACDIVTMVENPETGELEEEAESEDLMYLYTFNGSSLEKVIGPIFDYRCTQYAMDTDSEGTVYITYYGGVEDNRVNAIRINGDKAEMLGQEGSMWTNSGITTISAAIFPMSSTDVWVGHRNNTRLSHGAPVDRRTLNLAHFDGSTWENAIPIAGRNSSDYAYNVVGRFINDIPYMFIYNQNTQTVSLYKLESSAWSTVFESIAILKADGETPATLNLSASDFDVAANGDVYIMMAADYLTEAYNPAVVRINPQTQEQTIIGGVLSNIEIDSNSASISLGQNDVPYITYVGADENVYVSYISNTTKLWSSPVAISTSGATCGPKIRFAENGAGYITYLDESLSAYVLYMTE